MMPASDRALRTLLNRWVGVIEQCTVTTGYCCCGDSMENHSDPMICGHVAVDMGAYHVGLLLDDTRAALAKEST